ncbi:hypothetical protein GQ55_9G081700 [Panicum hallii var. hallii]|uniref:Uncharacterized protein n=1 Tax=Panicum hallii var. hallii TaxID=1504633 RepID=A0A2T7C0Z4_9POAL|nr:hypothetical protein GQ55_9G081700 [Panicum hallii var. hallii]
MPNWRALRGSVPLPSGAEATGATAPSPAPEPEAIPMHPPATAPRFERALAPGTARPRKAQAGPGGREGRARRERTGRRGRPPAVARCSGQPAGLPARPPRGGVCKAWGVRWWSGDGGWIDGWGRGDADARPCSDRGMPRLRPKWAREAGRAEARHVSPTDAAMRKACSSSTLST